MVEWRVESGRRQTIPLAQSHVRRACGAARGAGDVAPGRIRLDPGGGVKTQTPTHITFYLDRYRFGA